MGVYIGSFVSKGSCKKDLGRSRHFSRSHMAHGVNQRLPSVVVAFRGLAVLLLKGSSGVRFLPGQEGWELGV
jgi:hypothetical protein